MSKEPPTPTEELDGCGCFGVICMVVGFVTIVDWILSKLL